MRLIKYRKNLMLIAGLAAMVQCQAQETANTATATATPVQAGMSSSDQMTYLCLGAAFVLLLAIAAASQVLIRLSMYVYENKDRLAKSVLLIALMALTGSSYAQDVTPAAQPVAVASSSVGYSTEFIAMISVIVLEAFVFFVMMTRIWALLDMIYPKAEAQKRMKFELPRWFDRFNESVAVEHEKDIMLDHDYDGIKELDNSLPPWWKYGFAVSIVWAFCYLTYYHVLHEAPLSAGEYTNEMEAAKIAKDAYMRTAKNNVDENTIVFDASYVADGQKIFSENCTPCHGSKGEGGVGPNLTDNYWLHGGKINDLFKTVKYGWPANGMKSWQTDLTSMQIAQVVCYVKSLKGSNPPNPKAPQGELFDDSGAATKDTASTAGIVAKDSISK